MRTSDGTYNYQHDAGGNTTVRTRISNSYASDYETTYTWDYRNRLTDVEYYDNNDVLTKHVHFVYDVFDHLIATEVDPTGGGTYTGIQRYVLDVSPEIPLAGVPGTALAQPDLVFDGNQNLIERNLVALDPAGVDAVLVQGTVISPTQGDNDMFVADDNLGTPRDDTNGTGTLVNHKVFSAFGQDVYDSNPSIVNWSGIAGGHADPDTGLVNNYHRWYNPATGKWESLDPDGFAAGDANLDRYVGNNPASGNDPAGLYQPPGANYLPPPSAIYFGPAPHYYNTPYQMFYNGNLSPYKFVIKQPNQNHPVAYAVVFGPNGQTEFVLNPYVLTPVAPTGTNSGGYKYNAWSPQNIPAATPKPPTYTPRRRAPGPVAPPPQLRGLGGPIPGMNYRYGVGVGNNAPPYPGYPSFYGPKLNITPGRRPTQ